MYGNVINIRRENSKQMTVFCRHAMEGESDVDIPRYLESRNERTKSLNEEVEEIKIREQQSGITPEGHSWIP